MYILVQHTISDPASMWANAQQALGALPPHFTLHHCLAGADGRTAVCVWEAESIATLQTYLDPTLGAASKNEYTQAVNASGIAVPPAFQVS